MHNAISVLLFSCLAKNATRVHGVVHGSPAQGWVMMRAGVWVKVAVPTAVSICLQR